MNSYIEAGIDRGRSNQKVWKGNSNTNRCLLAFDLSRQFGNFKRERVEDQVMKNLIREAHALDLILNSSSSMDPVRQLNSSDRGNSNNILSMSTPCVTQNVAYGCTPPLVSDQDRSIENKTHALIPRRGVTRLAITQDLFHVSREGRIHFDLVASLGCSSLGERNGFGQGSARWTDRPQGKSRVVC
jgi:hypothetical protein